MTLSEKKKLYTRAKEIYYNDPNGKQLMTDAQFDALEDELRTIDPKWKGFSAGSKLKVKKLKTKLPIPIFSLDKTKPHTVEKWLEHHPEDKVVVSDKVDGAAMEIRYTDGLPTHAYTRGNGIIGGDVSYILPHLKIPKRVGTRSFIVRCEGIFTASAFEKHRKDFDAARNAASGVLNRTDIHVAVRDMSVVVLQVLQPNPKPSDGLKWAKKVGFTVIPHQVFRVSDLSGEKLSKLLKARKTKSKMALDGLVLTLDKINRLPTAGNPDWAVAFKENVNVDDLPIATVTHVDWEVSPHGYLKPTANYSPIKWGESTLRRANALNARFVELNGIGPGAQIKIVRSGDIIPKIEQVVKKGKAQMPDPIRFGETKWSKNRVDLMLAKPTKNAEFRVRRITKFMTEMGVDFMKEGNVKKLYDAGFDSIVSIMKAAAEDFLAIPGVKITTANKLHSAIHRVLDKPIPIVKLMDASGTFPRGLGSTRFQQIHDKWGMKAVFVAARKDPDKLQKAVLQLPGWQSITADSFIHGLEPFFKFLKITGLTPNFARKEKPVSKTSKLEGWGITWTGYRSEEEEQIVTENGGTVEKFGSKTRVLLFRPGGKQSTKIDTAKSKGIPVMTWEKFAKSMKL